MKLAICRPKNAFNYVDSNLRAFEFIKQFRMKNRRLAGARKTNHCNYLN